MLPRKLLASSAPLCGTEIVPRYLTEQDQPWLRALIEQYRRAVGRQRRELCMLLAAPLSVRAPLHKRRVAARVL
ncbi:MAG TPA: hypothetical protein VGP93_09175, partial [Polyangiaceae bacterium]|nr:hypothetical protein [Polyangiaceae bacterium]